MDSSNRLAKLDVRAGAEKGRIYRVYPEKRKLRAIRDLTTLKREDLAMALATTNGPTRDLVHREFLEHGESLSALSTNKAETEQLARQRSTTAEAVFQNLSVRSSCCRPSRIRRRFLRCKRRLFVFWISLATSCRNCSPER